MSRARRCVRLPRLLVAETPRDLAYNQAEVCRVLATERIDPDAARMILWAMDLTAAVLPAEPASRVRPCTQPQCFLSRTISSLFAGSRIENPSRVPEDTCGKGRGIPPLSRLGNPTGERVGFLQPRRRDSSKPSASKEAAKL